MTYELAIASISTEREPKTDEGYANKSRNLRTYLEDNGFIDFDTNQYYTLKMTYETMGVACAHKTQKKVDGKYVNLCSSLYAHFATSNLMSRYTNPKTIKVGKSAVTLKAGGKSSIKTTITKVKPGKLLMTSDHGAKIRYKSSNTYVAKVTNKGVIKAVDPGTCRVYVQAINGIYKAIKVTVQ